MYNYYIIIIIIIIMINSYYKYAYRLVIDICMYGRL